MFKRDPKGRFVYTDVGFFTKKREWRFASGKDKTEKPMDEEAYQKLLAAQQRLPVLVMYDSSSNKRWWSYCDHFYCEDEGLSAEHVQVLILDRFVQSRKKVQRAMARLSMAGDIGSVVREPIPDEIKTFVWKRDGGRCVRCASQEKLEYDHIIPLAKGGSNTARNIQLLCETCNREKGANLV